MLNHLRWCIFFLDILRLTLYLHFTKSCDITELGFVFIHKNGISAMRNCSNILNHIYIHWNMVPVIIPKLWKSSLSKVFYLSGSFIYLFLLFFFPHHNLFHSIRQLSVALLIVSET